MLVSLRWLQDYVDIPWSAPELADRLTMSGAKVEGIRELGQELHGVVAGRIAALERHPAREDLHVVTVDLGGRRVVSVCGAPNVAAGMMVAVALPGARLPGLSRPVAVSEVAGVRSEAVLCSEAELGLSDDHAGLMRLPEEVQPGTELAEALGLDDAVIEFEIYPNRPDCLSVIGVAREVAALTGGTVREPDRTVKEEEVASAELAAVEVHAPDLCPRYIARVVEGVRVGPSPAWMQQRLRAAGMRPINNVVDVTNFVMLELGQPLHAFDRARLAGSRIVVRRARRGETMRTLDGVLREFTEDDLLICDAEKPVAVAGVMGGEETEVSAATTSVLLESATFDPTSVRKTARRLGMRTEASHRFEKGLHPVLAELAIDRAAHLLAQLAGGRVAAGRIDVAQPMEEPVILSIRPERVNELLGTRLAAAEMARLLRSLHFDVTLAEDGSLMQVRVPWFRRDVRQECDIVEEIARLYGYDRIEATLPKGASLQGGLAWPLDEIERVRARLVAAGLRESITYSFISPKSFDRLGLPADDELRRAIPLRNPLSEEQSVMRTTLMGSLLEAASLNERRHGEDVRLFELAKVYVADSLPLTSLPEERWTLGIVLSGAATTSVWGAARPVDFFDLKGAVEAVAETLRIDVSFEPARHPALHPGRTAQVLVDGEAVGILGEVHPVVARAHSLRRRTYLAEIALERLLKAPRRPRRHRALPRFPAVARDLALLVPMDVPARRVEEVLVAAAGEHLRSLELFDVYQGQQVPEGMRSIAYTLTFQADDRTLTDEEINAAQERVAARLKEELGVEVRG